MIHFTELPTTKNCSVLTSYNARLSLIMTGLETALRAIIWAIVLYYVIIYFCYDVNHNELLNRYQQHISEACLLSSEAHIPVTCPPSADHVPGWKEYVAPHVIHHFSGTNYGRIMTDRETVSLRIL